MSISSFRCVQGMQLSIGEGILIVQLCISLIVNKLILVNPYSGKTIMSTS